MKILAAEFLTSTVEPERFIRDRLPEIAVAGRSNVGKSSLINSLLHRKGMARVSRTPGKTRTVNFFRIATTDPVAKRFYAVDLPGYGYAKVSRSLRDQWGPMIERYLTVRGELRGVLLLVDARGTAKQDTMAFKWLCALGREVVVVATKVDKLRRSERPASMAAIREGLQLSEATALIAYSARTHEGREGVWRAIRKILVGDQGQGEVKDQESCSSV